MQNKTYPPLRLKQYTSHAQIKQTLHSTRNNICSNNQNSYAAINIEQDQHINQPPRQTSDIQDLKKYDEKPF
jgi:hypothetical protein